MSADFEQVRRRGGDARAAYRDVIDDDVAHLAARVVAEKGANLTRVGVRSSNGVVYLSGTVAAPESRQKAETLAGGVRGVRRVVNMLAIGPGP